MSPRLFAGETRDNLTPRQLEYREFLASPEWDKLRRACYRKAGNKCVRCNGGGILNAHHVRYPEDVWKTVLSDLECLCRECHRAEHGLAVEPKPRQEAPKPTLGTIEEVRLARSRHQITRKQFKQRLRELGFNKWKSGSGPSVPKKLRRRLEKRKLLREEGNYQPQKWGKKHGSYVWIAENGERKRVTY